MRRLLALALAAAALAPGLHAADSDLRRFALVVGSNVGGKTTTNLKYAAEDAKKMRDILVRIGGIREEDLTLLVNPEKDSLANALAFMATKVGKVRANSGETQFVFYYSGHSDARGLLLYGEYYDYGELRKAMDSLGAEVRVVILDSCSSGAFTRDKGGAMTAPFLIDESSSVEGHAYITSSTAEEASQESDKIESSFFTHFLLNGLRGAADDDGDGKVSLNEAYGYVYDRTLSETEKTRSGAQHPAFDIQLNGIGDLVMTDIRNGDALLKLPGSLTGRLSLRDVSDKLVLELRKEEGTELRVGVEQGYYRLVLDDGKSLWETILIVDEKKEYEVRRDSFRGIKASPTARRGSEASPFSLFPIGFRLDSGDESSSLYLNLLGGKTAAVDGVMLSILYNQTIGSSTGYQGSLFSNFAGGDYHGMQGSAGVNYSKGDFVGLQLSPVFNGTAGTMKGLQVSGFNYAGADLMIGQIGGVNVAAGEGGYVQLGAYNLSKRSIRGLQAGLLNVGKNVAGLQVGLVNYSEDHNGIQLGIVNVSKRLNGIPIGIVDIQFNGENHIDFVVQSGGSSFEGMAEKLYATTYFRFGSRYFYKYFDFGFHGPRGEVPDGYPAFIAGAGLGLRIPALFEGFAFHADAGANYQSPISRLELVEDPQFLHKIVPQFRLFASCKLFRNAGILAGLENWIFTKYFHDFPADASDFEILTEYGLLMVDSRLFIGVQL